MLKINEKKALIIITATVFFVFFSRFIINGKDSVVIIHDNLDRLNMLSIFDKTYSPEKDFYFPGEKKIYKLDQIRLNRPLFEIFGYFKGAVIYDLILRILGFLGIFLLLERMNKKYFNISAYASFGISIAFAFLPHHPANFFSVLGIPLLILMFHNLYIDKFKISSIIILAVFPFCARFTTMGFFTETILMIHLIIIFFRKRTVFAVSLTAFIIHTAAWAVSSYPVFLAQFAGSPTHRNLISGGYLSLIEALKRSFQVFTFGQYHALALQGKIIIPSSAIIAVFLIIRKHKIKLQGLLVSLLSYNTAAALIYGFYYFEPVRLYIENLELGFNFYRFYFISSALWYIIWAILIFNLLSAEKRYRATKVFAGTIILLQVIYAVSFRGMPYTEGGPAFSAIMSEKLFASIKKRINYNENEYIGCIGFFPAVANYNGFKTIGAYSNLYSFGYKDVFRKIIEKELKQNKEIMNYFDNWGSRAYLFDNKIGRKYNDQRWIKENVRSIKCDLDIKAIKELNCTYLFSTAEIENYREKGLKRVYTPGNRNDYYRMFVYKIEEGAK